MKNITKIENHSTFNPDTKNLYLPNVVYFSDNYDSRIYNKSIENKVISDWSYERTSSNEYFGNIINPSNSFINLFNEYGEYGLDLPDWAQCCRPVSLTQAGWNDLFSHAFDSSYTFSNGINENFYNNLIVEEPLILCGSATDTFQFNICKAIVTSKTISGSNYYMYVTILNHKTYAADKPPIEYTLDFDCKVGVNGGLTFYMYSSPHKFCVVSSSGIATNGNNSASMSLSATTSYQHYQLKYVPACDEYSSTTGPTQCILSLYGVYNTGRIPSVKNVVLKVTRNVENIYTF